jgi:drug/metabolite transporter (DMT)-like permease
MIIIPFQLMIEFAKRYTTHTSVDELMQQTIQGWKETVQSSILELTNTTVPNDRHHRSVLSRTSLKLAILLCIPSYLWYLSVNLTTASNLTAIYNTSCLSAYVFAILMLHERVVPSKMGAIVLCMVGVVAMAFWPQEEKTFAAASGALGIVTATIGAVSVGFYEVYYKKYASPKRPTLLFANTLSGGIGVATFFVLWIPIPLLHFADIEHFQWPDLHTILSIFAIALSSMIYNATCMAVIALIGPVFAAVGVMLTIPAVAITDVFVTGNMVPASTIVGSLFILAGFVVLNRKVHEEVMEEEEAHV